MSEPHFPTEDEAVDRALKIFQEEWLRTHPGEARAPTPEIEELREGNYLRRARSEIMSGYRGDLEAYRSYLEGELEKVREDLGIKPPPELEDLEKNLDRLEAQLGRNKEALKRAKEREAELEEEIRRLREKAPPPPPPVAPPPPPTPPIYVPPTLPPKPLVPPKPEVPAWRICPIHKVELERAEFIPVTTETLREVEPEVDAWVRQHWQIRVVPIRPPAPPEMRTLKVPETLEIYWCPEDGGHWFERVNAKSEERSLAFLLRKVEREGRRLERLVTPPLPPWAVRRREIIGEVPYRPEVGPYPGWMDFWTWLLEQKRLTMHQWVGLREDEKFLLKEEYKKWVDERIVEWRGRGLI